jgi:polar amino acid transport system ATP-binding protein
MSDALPAISAHDVCKSFGGFNAVLHVDLSVRVGETVCIIGPSGSGKSTLLRCMNWLSPPTSGEVRIGGEPLGQRRDADGRLRLLPDIELRRQRSRIGMVFQGFHLWPHLTVAGNVMEGLVVVRRQSRHEARDRAMAMLERVGLASKHADYPAQLSGGQQQRVAIARALAMEPEILLFDEPTSALDPELVGEVLDVMADLARRHTTMLVVTHEIGFAAEAADRLVLMDAGRIIEQGPPAQLLREPTTERARDFISRYLRRNAGLASIVSG